MPQISVVTSVHNGEAYLEQCVDSVMKQTFQDFEYIILDNGSTDSTPDILSRYTDPRIRIINQKNLGIVNSLIKSVILCKTDLIARLDADDYAYPNWLESNYEYLKKNQDVVVCSSQFEELIGEKLYPQSFPYLENDDEIRKSLAYVNPMAHSLSVIRRASLLGVGGYDPKMTIAHDYDLWVRLLEKGKGHNLKQSLGVHRTHEASCTLQKERTMIKEAFQVQWRAYRKLGGSFLKMFSSIFRKVIMWFLPSAVRSNLRAISKRW